MILLAQWLSVYILVFHITENYASTSTLIDSASSSPLASSSIGDVGGTQSFLMSSPPSDSASYSMASQNNIAASGVSFSASPMSSMTSDNQSPMTTTSASLESQSVMTSEVASASQYMSGQSMSNSQSSLIVASMASDPSMLQSSASTLNHLSAGSISLSSDQFIPSSQSYVTADSFGSQSMMHYSGSEATSQLFQSTSSNQFASGVQSSAMGSFQSAMTSSGSAFDFSSPSSMSMSFGEQASGGQSSMAEMSSHTMTSSDGSTNPSLATQSSTSESYHSPSTSLGISSNQFASQSQSSLTGISDSSNSQTGPQSTMSTATGFGSSPNILISATASGSSHGTLTSALASGSSHSMVASGATYESSQDMVSSAASASGSSQSMISSQAAPGSSQSMISPSMASGSSQAMISSQAASGSSQSMISSSMASGSSQGMISASTASGSTQNMMSATVASQGSSQSMVFSAAASSNSQSMVPSSAASASSQSMMSSGTVFGSSQSIVASASASTGPQNSVSTTSSFFSSSISGGAQNTATSASAQASTQTQASIPTSQMTQSSYSASVTASSVVVSTSQSPQQSSAMLSASSSGPGSSGAASSATQPLGATQSSLAGVPTSSAGAASSSSPAAASSSSQLEATTAAPIDYCAGSPCENNGTCTDTGSDFVCNCTGTFYGKNCSLDINGLDECANNPCRNGASCIDGNLDYTCDCLPGYAGKNCTSNIDDCASNPCRQGGTCIDGVNTFTCICPAGYTGSTCRTEINECGSSPCLNGGSCVDGVADYTCYCQSGYTDKNCSTNIDECIGVTCQNGGTCLDQINGYICQCINNTYGANCQYLSPFYQTWNAWGNCSESCGSASYRNRSRVCTNIQASVLSDSDCIGFNLGQSQEVESCNVSECIVATNPCTNPRIPVVQRPCSGHICGVTSTGSYRCICSAGYDYPRNAAGQVTSEQQCVDEDECSFNTSDCKAGGQLKTGVRACVNSEGSYLCKCATGYTQQNGTRLCVDIDECSLGQHTCDTGRAQCINTVGSYTCQCNVPYVGDGFTGNCKANRFIPFANHTLIPFVNSNTTVKSPFIFPKYGIPMFDGQIFPSLYFVQHGVIAISSVTTDEAVADPVKRDFRTAPSVPLMNFTFQSDFQERAIVAPFWTNLYMSDQQGGRGVYYKEYTVDNPGDQSPLEDISDLVNKKGVGYAFQAQYMLVVTWYNMQHKINQHQNVSLQAVLVTDYVNTAVVYTYADRDMNWRLTLDPANQPNYPVRVGYLVRGSAQRQEEYIYSYASISDQSHMELIDTENATGTGDGVFVYLLSGNNQGSFVNPGLACNEWISGDDLYDSQNSPIVAGKAGKCPGGLNQLTSSWSADPTQVIDQLEVQCYKLAFPEGSGVVSETPSCCYYTNTTANGALSMSLVSDWKFMSGGNIYRRFHPGTSQGQAEVAAFTQCCINSTVHCSDFLQKRPMCDSSTFVPPGQALSAGDPHVTTLDGLSFSFNGYGEYTVITGNNFNLQGRTAPAVTDTPPARATVFNSFAAKQVVPGDTDSDVVELRLNSTTGSDIDVLVNGVVQTVDFSSTQTYNKVTITKTGSEYSMVFSTQVEVKTSASYNMTTISVAAPASWKGTLSGLLGNFNDDPSDDIKFSNGTQLLSNSTEEELYYWGQTWAINPAQSLFTYESGVTAQTYGNDSFLPLFFNLDTMFADNSTKWSAINACGGMANLNRECVYDIALTGNEAAGVATASSQTQFAEEKAAVNNFPPTINNNNTVLFLIAGQDMVNNVTISAQDQNQGDTVTFSLAAPVPTGVAISSSSGELAWSSVPSTLTANTTVKIVASDGKANTALLPKLYYCKCQNGGTCKFNIESTDLFTDVPCECTPGREGQYCERDIDGCADNPCFTGVACVDVAAPGTGFQCGTCPLGLVGDGSVCSDEDECQRTPSPCTQSCSNLPGSYQCSCGAGYILGPDLKTCLDIDECSRGTHDCDSNAACNNTVGSYTCTCNTGYTGLGTTGQCDDVNECSTSPCQTNAVCTNLVGSYRCDCSLGYELDTVTGQCTEIDECTRDNTCQQTCIDGVATYTCGCTTGFVLDATDQVSCIPEQQCNSVQNATCDYTGDAAPLCAVIQGEVTCNCPPKYTATVDKKCVDIDECAGAHLCRPASVATCVNTVGDYTCGCATGYKLDVDGRTCVDVDECTELSNGNPMHNCDLSRGFCSNSLGSYFCSCNTGYNLNATGNGCDDKNECASSTTNDCNADFANCTNTLGSYTCTCKTGFTGDGVICADENECALANRGGCMQGCSNSIGSFSCFCGNGYVLDANGLTCSDYDECSREADNGCYSSQYCTNTVGSYSCSCPSDFLLASDGKTCNAANECASNHNCSHTCAKISGNDTCQCPKGYQLDDSGKNCTDVDECASNSTHGCSADNNVVCVNDPGSYHCVCSNTSLYQQVEARKCIDIDECSSGSATCPSFSSCVNLSPGYRCDCQSGYNNTGGLCQDIDECSSGSHNCHPTLGICTNTAGAYTCACMSGYSGDGITCSDINECAAADAGGCDVARGRGTCLNYVGGSNCSCISGYVLNANGKTCDDLNECDPGNPQNDCSQICNNVPGGFTCECQPGFALASDQRNCTLLAECPANHTCSDLCAMVLGQNICSCRNSFYKLSSDNQTCIDVNECTDSYPCVGNSSTCLNTAGGFSCNCTDGFRLGADKLTCADRDGGLTSWTAWSSCSVTCGGGSQSRTRSCSNPSQAGNGLPCTGQTTETQQCNTDMCPLTQAEEDYGIVITISGVTITQLTTSVQNSILQKLVDALNDYCIIEGNFATCCPNSGTRQNTSATGLSYTNTTYVEMGEGFPRLNPSDSSKVDLLIVAKAPLDNDVCALGSVTQSGRKKRGVTVNSGVEFAFPQATLTTLVQQSSTQSSIVTAIVTYYPTATVAVSQVQTASAAYPSAVTVTVVVTVASNNETTTSNSSITTESAIPVNTGTEAWVIAVSVVGAVLLVIVVIVVVLVILKKPQKVSNSSGELGVTT